MFERYTEGARRVLFFARYEASEPGSLSIEAEHLLLGLIRDGHEVTREIFARSHPIGRSDSEGDRRSHG
jgi:ATP-dependent Clp protease ATP-binding subunit ClpC